MALINCKECGKPVSDSATVCPHCGAPVIRDVFCPKCGTKVPENVKFCPNCGEPVRPLNQQTDKKDKTLAGIFAILLGTLGIQYFYLGKPAAGAITILISLCTCSAWGLVMLIQGIMMLTMSEADFEEKYVKTDKTFPLF